MRVYKRVRVCAPVCARVRARFGARACVYLLLGSTPAPSVIFPPANLSIPETSTRPEQCFMTCLSIYDVKVLTR